MMELCRCPSAVSLQKLSYAIYRDVLALKLKKKSAENFGYFAARRFYRVPTIYVLEQK